MTPETISITVLALLQLPKEAIPLPKTPEMTQIDTIPSNNPVAGIENNATCPRDSELENKTAKKSSNYPDLVPRSDVEGKLMSIREELLDENFGGNFESGPLSETIFLLAIFLGTCILLYFFPPGPTWIEYFTLLPTKENAPFPATTRNAYDSYILLFYAFQKTVLFGIKAYMPFYV